MVNVVVDVVVVVVFVLSDVNSERLDRIERTLNSLAIDHNLMNYDIWTERGRSAAEQTEFKETLLDFYDRRGTFFHRGEAKCMVTNEWHSKDLVIAGHIWKSCKHGVGLQRFGLQRSDAASARNGLLMLKDIEDAFDVKDVCFVYNPVAREFRLRVLKPALLDRTIANSSKTFREIDNAKLKHRTGKIPYRRLLSFHARCAFKAAKERGWITSEEEAAFQPYHDLSDTASVPDVGESDTGSHHIEPEPEMLPLAVHGLLAPARR